MDTKQIRKQLSNLAREIPYATAVSLTKTAQDVQKDLIEHTKRVFTIRRNWLEKGKYAIRITPATKLTLQSRVWNDAPWMNLFEEGGTRKPQKRFFAVPQAEVKRNKKDMITKSNRPRNLTRSFLIKQKDTNRLMIFKRVSKKKIKFMYALSPDARIKSMWDFVKTGTVSIRRHWEKNVNEVLQKLLKGTPR